MVDQGFLAPRPIRPGTIAAVVIGHAALLAAVILVKGPDIVPLPRVIQTYWVPDTTPPPPLPPEPAPPTAQPPSTINRPTRVVDAAQPNDTMLATGDPVIVPMPDTVLRPVDPPAMPKPLPDPVLVDAQPDPRFADRFQPAYPPALQRAEVEGRATVRVLIGSDGHVRSVEILSADDPAFAEATRRQALKSWRFTPATRDGVAVENWRTMTVRFRLQA